MSIPETTRADRRRAERELLASIKQRLEEQMPSAKKMYSRKETIDLLASIQKETMLKTMEVAMTAVSETKGIGTKRADDVYNRIYELLQG